jgi:hypothetical protein
MSISPLMRALVRRLLVGDRTHSTRSTLAILPPARPDGGSARGLYLGFLT